MRLGSIRWIMDRNVSRVFRIPIPYRALIEAFYEEENFDQTVFVEA